MPVLTILSDIKSRFKLINTEVLNNFTEDIYKLTENFANTTKKYSGFDLKADVPDNYCIYLQIV